MKDKFTGKVVEVKEKKSGEILLIIVSEPKTTETKELKRIERRTVRFHTKDKTLSSFIGAKASVVIDNDSAQIRFKKVSGK